MCESSVCLTQFADNLNERVIATWNPTNIGANISELAKRKKKAEDVTLYIVL